MKSKILLMVITAIMLLSFSNTNFGQAPNLGTAVNFALFTSVGAVTNTGTTYLTKVTGNVGTNSAPTITGFGNVNGQMHYVGDPASTQCDADLILASNSLASTIPDSTLGVVIGNGDTLPAGIYLMPGAASLNLGLTLDAQGDPNAVFIFKTSLAFSTSANAKVYLINGAQACNVFWKLDGAVTLGAGTYMKGTIISGGAISLSSGDTLEGRALSTNGAILTDNVLVYTPVGCGSPVLMGPAAPSLVSMECFTIFSSDGPVTNVGDTYVTGDVGTNNGLTTGFNPLFVTGAIHPIPDGITAAGASDLLNAYAYLNALPYDIELLYPAQFGHNLVLTPHTYLMNGAVTFTDSLYLDAMGDANAVFIIKTYGAFSTSTFSRVILVNGTIAKNVYWLVQGAVSINDYSIFNGTIVCNNGAMDLNTGVVMNGRALTTTGALNTTAITAIMPPGCGVPPTNIITEPENQVVCDGGSASFTVSVDGIGMTYQWRKGNINLTDGGNISGATTATLTINPVTIADTSSFYNVLISGGPNDTSIYVSLMLDSGPVIITEPMDQIACTGDSAGFTVSANGNGLTYQWRRGTVNLVNGVNIYGSTSDTLVINPVSSADTASNYNVVVSGLCGINDTSANVSLILGVPTIITQPVNQIVCAGSSVSFSVNATGLGLTYQWRKGNIDIAGANSATFIINPVSISDTSSFYNVIINGTCAISDTSINVSLGVDTSPNIITEPGNQAVCAGTSVSFSINSTGLTYQWRLGTLNLTDGGTISGATTAILTINPVNISDAASNYNVVVSGICATNDTSINVSLAVNTAPNITTEPSDQAACAGSSVSFSVVASGTGLTYQWRNGNINLIDGGNISGANSATLLINPVNISDTAYNYNVVVSGVCSPNDTSINVSLTTDSPYIITEPANQVACAGSSASFSVSATGTGLLYQWRNGNADISGANSDVYIINTVSASDTSSYYNVIITGTCAPNDTSINVSLMLNSAPNNITEPINQTVCDGSSASFSVNATGTGLTYQWRKGVLNLVNSGNISGATSAILIINPVSVSDTASNYNVIITGTCSPNDTSINVALILNIAPVITLQPSNQTACAGSLVSFSVSATGAGLSYQWRNGNVNLINGGNIFGATFATFIINPANISDTSSNYNVVVSGTCSPNDISVNVSFLISSVPIITTEPVNQITCVGNPVSFSVTSTGSGLAYQWRKGNINLNNGGNISGATSAILAINPVNISDIAANYNVVVSGVCSPDDTSSNVSLTIDSPYIVTEPADQTACEGSSVSFSVVSTGTGLTYQWRKGTLDLINAGNISGATSATLTINPVSISDAGANYYIVITGTCAPDEYSVNVSLVINTIPNITAEPVNKVACSESIVSFSVIASGTGISYQWKKGTITLNNGGNISGATSATLTINPAAISDAALNYYVIIYGACTSNDTSANVSLSVNQIPVAVASVNSPVCAGSSINLIAETVSGATYSWTNSLGYSSSIQNAVIPSALLSDAGNYSLVVSANGCVSEATTVTVVINNCNVIEFHIPQGFSPNADGINDLFVIRGIEYYPYNSIIIYNRWGDKVFEANPYQNNWAGNSTEGLRLGGDELPVGTYFYILDLGDNNLDLINKKEVLKGTIYLNRQK